MVICELTHNRFICDSCGANSLLLKKFAGDTRPPTKWSVGKDTKCDKCLFEEVTRETI